MGETDEGFEGGQTGSAGEGGFSAAGSGGLDSSSASDPPPLIDPEELEGAVFGRLPIPGVPEGVIDVAGGAAEILHSVETGGGTPFLIVPKEELEKLIGDRPADDA
jgi:hypothetical protein